MTPDHRTHIREALAAPSLGSMVAFSRVGQAYEFSMPTLGAKPIGVIEGVSRVSAGQSGSRVSRWEARDTKGRWRCQSRRRIGAVRGLLAKMLRGAQ